MDKTSDDNKVYLHRKLQQSRLSLDILNTVECEYVDQSSTWDIYIPKLKISVKLYFYFY